MVSYSVMTMWMLALLFSVFYITVSGLTMGDEFEYLQRRLEDNEWTLSNVSDIEEEADEWPDGSYTLLMSKYGCPKGRWNRGYVAFTWKLPHIMLSHTHTHHCDNYSTNVDFDNNRCHQLISEKTRPTSYSNMFGPFSQYKMTLTFCQKINNTEKDDPYPNSIWPKTYFRILDAHGECPQGFDPTFHNITLPPVEKWTENGFIPYFSLENDQENKASILTLRECVRANWNELNETKILNTNDSTFILLKDQEHPCPVIETYDVWPEIISIADVENASSGVSRLFQFCFYQPEPRNDSNTNSQEIGDYELKPFKVVYRGTEEPSHAQESPGKQLSVLYNASMYMLLLSSSGKDLQDQGHTMYCSKHTTCWIIFDIGRSSSINGVSLEKVLPTGAVFNYAVQAGNDKFELIRYGGVEIPQDKVGSSFVGRYIMFMIPNFNLTIGQFSVRVFVESTDMMCMVDIGMTDGSITKNQISVSSEQYSANIDSVRPNNLGWCANDGDIHPYVQVDLLEETWLDGITIYNWYKTNINITNGTYGTCNKPMGTRLFKVLSSSEENMAQSYNMTFHVDLFRPPDEPQTFIFYEHIRARYVRILLLEQMTNGQLCIRFELHGCRNDDIIHRPSLIYKRDGNDHAMTGAVKTLTSPSQFTSVGYPLSYRDGTSYTWIIDFRSIGFIKLIFKEISLQSYEDQSLETCSYLCKDSFTISSFDSVWTFPSKKYDNFIIETDDHSMVIEFTSCNPYTPRIRRGENFNVYADKSDIPACSNSKSNYMSQYCTLPSMLITTLSLNNVPTDSIIESWIIMVPKYSIRLTILHFHISCNSGAVLEIKEQFKDATSYTDCNPPESVLLSESERMTITFKVGQNSNDSLMSGGFRAIYSTVEINYRHLLDTIGHHYYGLRKIEYITDFYASNMLPNGRNNGTSLLVYKACSVTFMKCYTIYSHAPMSWQVAGDECWGRGKKLVSIHSKEELFVVKYMLRTFRNVLYDDNTVSRIYTTDIADPNYYSHIGVSRITKANGNQQFVWQDGSPVLFSAWNTGEPNPDGDCVRMSFHLANKNNTWEVEDCVTQMALFFICEEPVNSLPLPEFKSINSKVYTGKMNTTRYGRLCQRWDSMVPHNHTYTAADKYPGGNISLSKNYCRDPSNDGYLWCFTMDPSVRWGKCDDTNLYDWTSKAYTGRLSTTVNGYKCQRWDSQSPHTHRRGMDEYFPENSVSDASNYCRDPMDEGELWCYTTDPGVRYDFCKPEDIISDRCYETHYPYLGTMNLTYSGLTCQHWSSTYPHKHYHSDTKFPDGSISKAENFCRDPSNKGYLWCFTTDPDIRWESCSVQVNVKSNTTTTLINDMFTCKNGYQISTKKICNGIVDCVDAQDELNCTYKVQKLLGSHVMNGEKGTRLETHFRCGSNEYISLLAECDGVVDCIDGSDERFCKRETKECLNHEFQCGDGSCIHASLVCDFIPHCTDFSDENCDHPECRQGEYRCRNGQCIAMKYRCNGYEECVDGSDERKCETCSKTTFHCDLTKCIPERLVCDNVPDCKDMKDENEQKCKRQQYLRCEDRWLSGLRKNGQYPVTGSTFADCNFDNVKNDGSILTTYPAVQSRSEARIHYIEIASTSSSDKLKLNAYTICHQTFTQTCKLPVLTIAEIEDKNLKNHYKHCRCVVLTVTLNQPTSAYVHSCGNETDRLDDSVMSVKYDFVKKALVKQMPFNHDIEIEFGSIVCKNDSYLSRQYSGVQNETVDGFACQRWDEQVPHSHSRIDIRGFPDSTLESAENYCRDPDFTGIIWCYTLDPNIRWQKCSSDDFVQLHKDLVKDTRRTCEEDGFTYDDSLRCIYETDEAGYIRGCRSGSHLLDCSDFECPNGTIKCPGSFCIPVHYVCDGVNQCQSSEDEHGCGCNNDGLELILMASKKEMYENDLKLRQVAGQFSNQNAIVRILYYNAYMDQDIMPFEHRILQISDTEVDKKSVISHEYECTYSMMASRFMNQVKFTKVKSRSLIFIQNGTDSESVARHMFHNMSRPEFNVYRLVIGPPSQQAGKKEDGYRYVTDMIVNSLDILSSMGHKLFPSLCKDSTFTLCQDRYKCSSSLLCIAFDKVCDGFAHCPLSDDEMFCGFVCPSVCTCTGYSANCKSATFENSTNISQDIDRRLRVLDLSTNTRVGTFANSNEDLVFKFPYMIRLNLSACNIWQISTNYFEHLPNLMSLDLSYNKISRILRRTFFGLSKLVYLNMYGNKGFMIYESFAFFGLTSLRNIDIIDSDINRISYNTFSGLKLDILQISRNNILELESDAFSGLVVRNIIFESNSIATFDRGIFNGLSGLELLRTSAYKYCCVRPEYLSESSCFPERDEFSSCDDLMRNTVLQFMLWLMGICALLGNLLAVAYRIVYDREKLKLGFGIFVINLAVSDLLMGVYLLIIAIADASYRKRYIFMDEYWRNSGWCTLAGVLATVSSEASALLLCLITLDRFLVIKYPLSRLRFTPRNASIVAAVAWILSVSISITPLIAKDHFQNRFYSKSGVCVALPLTRDRPPGWLYSVIIFIGVNFVTFVVIAIGQISIYNEINNVSSVIKNKRRGQSKTNRRKELTIARNLFLVVATDFMCWIPICFMGIVAMSGYIIPGQVYAWVAVFILPVNSSVNPFLYTLPSLLGNRKRKGGEMSDLSERITKPVKKKLGSEKLISFFIYQYSTTMTSVESLIEQNIVMSPNALLKFTIQMTDCLRLLHKNSLVLETLDAKSVFVPMHGGKRFPSVGRLHTLRYYFMYREILEKS